MKKLLIVAATKEEIAPFLAHFNLHSSNFIVADQFDVLLTGVGMTATAFALGQHLSPNYSLVLNVGIAGSFAHHFSLGTVVMVETDIFAELGAEDGEKFIGIEELGFGSSTFNSAYSYDALPKVKSITVNKVHGNGPSIAAVVDLFNPEIESMEGAAVFYACAQIKVPCLQIRSLSNYVVPRAKADWKIKLAIDNLNTWLVHFVSTYRA